MTWPEASSASAGASTLIVPLGSTEQHGPHLPVETDTIIARCWADRVAGGLGRAVVAPTLAFGSAGEHQGFAGTLSIGGPALMLVVVELARSAAHSFERIAFLSGHAGNGRPLRQAVEQLRREGHDAIHRLPTWPSVDIGLSESGAAAMAPIDAHAGRTETSLMLHLRPDLVRLDRAEPGNTRPVGELMDGLTTAGVAAVAANGVLGDPAGANADEGRRLLDDLVERTVADLRAWIDPEPAPPVWDGSESPGYS